MRNYTMHNMYRSISPTWSTERFVTVTYPASDTSDVHSSYLHSSMFSTYGLVQ